MNVILRIARGAWLLMACRTAATLIALSISLLAIGAEAQSRTACFTVGIADNRNRCPGRDYSTAGARFTCDGSAVGIRVELWDADDVPRNDDLIGTYVVTSAGQSCVTFNWTDTTDPPDLYLRILPSARAPTGGPILTAQQNVGTPTSPSWARYPFAWTRDWAQVNNCAAGATCTIAPGQVLRPSADPFTDVSQAFMVLQSGARSLQAFAGSFNGTAEIIAQVDELTQWRSTQQCPTACAGSRTQIRVPLGWTAQEADRTSHELGHVAHMREFAQDSLPGYCGADGWWMGGRESDSCATTEGFAAFFAAATWYDGTNLAAQPSYSGFDMENPAWTDPDCFSNHDIPGQVAKGFWDLHDVANEANAGFPGASERHSMSHHAVLNGWSTFASGFGNRQNDELGAEGMNLWDYWVNALSATMNDTYETLLYHNCLADQTF